MLAGDREGLVKGNTTRRTRRRKRRIRLFDIAAMKTTMMM